MPTKTPPNNDQETRNDGDSGAANPAEREKSAANDKRHNERVIKTALRAAELGTGLAARGAFGEKAEKLGAVAHEELKTLTPKQLEDIESHIFGDDGAFKNPNWYKQQAKAGAKKASKSILDRILRRQKRLLALTLLPLVVIGVIFLVMIFLAPFKHIHFETVLRTANFARFQLLVREQFSRVIFDASVLTRDSVGTFRNSPLVRQIRLAVPDRQLAKLGSSGRVQWEFRPNGSFGDEFLPTRESLKAVTIRDDKGVEHRFDLDEIARENFGADYEHLTHRQRWTVQNIFVRGAGAQFEELLRLLPRHVRWNPMFRLHQRTGARLVKWLDAARSYTGMTPEEARAENARQTGQRVSGTVGSPKSSIPDINLAAEEIRQATEQSVASGQPPPGPSSFRDSVLARARVARGVSDVVFAATSYCLVRELSKLFGPTGLMERQARAVRLAADNMTTTDQIKSHDTTPLAVYAANQQWDSQGEIPGAEDSVFYKQATGQPIPQDTSYAQQIPLLDPLLALGEWRDEFTAMGEALESGPLEAIAGYFGIQFNTGATDLNNATCTFLMNQWVQGGIAVAESIASLLTLGIVKGIGAAVRGAIEIAFHAGVGYAVGLGTAELLNLLTEWVIKEYAGLSFSGYEVGVDKYNAAHVATESVAQNSIRGVTYGRPLDPEEASAAQDEAMAALRSENKQKPLSERYFAIDNPFSLIGLTVAKLPASAGGFANSLRNSLHTIGSILSSPFRLFEGLGNILQAKRVFAQEASAVTIATGVEPWGWSQAERERIASDPTFSLTSDGDNAPTLLSIVEPRLEELNERYGACYDTNTFQLQADKPEHCTKEFLSAGHPQYGDDALYWRFYNALMFAATHLGETI